MYATGHRLASSRLATDGARLGISVGGEKECNYITAVDTVEVRRTGHTHPVSSRRKKSYHLAYLARVALPSGRDGLQPGRTHLPFSAETRPHSHECSAQISASV